ncbi:MAG: hypothetical protein ABI140_00805, partial [Jatrophihabitantaceae bacterium]
REGRGQQASLEQVRVDLRAQVSSAAFPAAGSWRIQFGFPKGGTGKSPTTAAVSMLLADLRGELVAAVDGDPRNSTLRRLMVPGDAGWPDPWLSALPEIRADADNRRPGRPMVPDPASLRRFSDLVGRVRVFTNLAAGQAQSEAMTGQDYIDFIEWLSDGPQLVMTDLGNDKASDLAIAQMRMADQLVACVKFQQDQIEGVVSWLSALCGQQQSYSSDPDSYAGMDDGQFGELARRAIIVIAPSGGDQTELAPLLEWLNNTTSLGRAPRPDGTPNGRLVIVPHDGHIAVGDVLRLDQLAPATEAAYLQVAALIAENWRLPPLSRRAGAQHGSAARRPVEPQPPTLPVIGEAASGLPDQLSAIPAAAEPPEHLVADALADAAGAVLGDPAGSYSDLVHGRGGQVLPIRRSGGRAFDPRAFDPREVGREGPGWVRAPAAVPPAAWTAAGLAARTGEDDLTDIVTDAAFVLGIDIGQHLRRRHTVGEVCTGCPDPDCAWPMAPPVRA